MTLPLPFQNIDDFALYHIIQDTPYSMAVESYQNSLQRKVFIKLLKPQIKDHHLWFARFQREAQICAKLKNPHIVDVYIMGEKESYTYMAMEFVEGLSLKDLLTRKKSLSPEISFEITRQVLMALKFAHQQGIIHRDIKPGNILIDIYGDVRLTDFGLAYLGEENSLTQQGAILGTPAYMSPEQITGESITPASDFFSLGATLYEMLTGVKPFAGENYSACLQNIMNTNPSPPSEYNNSILPEQENFVFKLLDKIPAQRPESATVILEQLKTITGVENVNSTKVKVDIASLLKKYYNFHSNEKAGEIASKKISVKTNDLSEKTVSHKWIAWAFAAVIVLSLLTFFIFVYPKKETQYRTENQTLIETDSLNSKSGLVHTNSEMDKSENNLQKEKNPDSVLINHVNNRIISKNNFEASKNISLDNLNEEKSILEKNMPKEDHPILSEIHLNIQPWAKITVDGTIVDSMAVKEKITLSPGKHQLVLSHPEFAPKLIEFETIPGQIKQIDFSFLNEAGFLSVEVRPWADIFIDGKHVDSTPLDRLILLSKGEHLLELKNPYYDSYRKILNVVAGDTIFLKQKLNKMN